MRKWIACLLVIMLAAAAFGTVLADPEKPEWEYSAKDAKITKYNGPGGDVVVPAEIDGNPVIFIDGSTFPSSREEWCCPHILQPWQDCRQCIHLCAAFQDPHASFPDPDNACVHRTSSTPVRRGR